MEEVISNIRGVLISNKGKTDLRELQKDYRMLMGEDIPYRKLGYSNLEQLVAHAPSLSISHGPNGITFVEAAVSNTSKHMVNLISKQKPKKRSKTARLPTRFYNARSGPIPRFQSQNYQKTPFSTNQKWRAPFVNRARPKSHVHQIVVSIDGNAGNGAQQRLVRSVSSYSPPLQNTDSSSRKVPVKLTRSLSAQIRNKNQSGSDSEKSSSSPNSPQLEVNTKQNSVIDNRPRMRSHQSFVGTPTTPFHPQDMGGGPRHPAPSLSLSTIKSLLMSDKIESSKEKNWSSSVSSQNREQGKIQSASLTSTSNTGNSTNGNNSIELQVNNSKSDLLAELQSFARTHNLGEPVVKLLRTTKAGRLFICSIKIDSQSFSSYPRDCFTSDEAVTEAARNALAVLSKRYLSDQRSLLISTELDVLNRIPPIIELHFSGVWAEQIALDYKDKYGEQLPPNWLALLDTLPTISVEPALNDRHVLKMCKVGEKKSNSSTTNSAIQQQLLTDVSVPSNKVHLSPEGWYVEVTYVASTVEIWCRRVDTEGSDRYCEMATKMQLHYTNAGGSERATNVAPGGFYVVSYEGCWSRVRVLNTSEYDVTCFFIDYGDEHNVPKSDMYILSREFAREQAQAFVCRLSGLEELANMSAATNILENIANGTYLAKPQISEEIPVDLGPSAISIILYEVGANVEDDSSSSGELGENINLRLMHQITADSVPILDPQNINRVYVTFAAENGDIYIQCHSEAFNKLNELIMALTDINFDEEFPGQHIPTSGSRASLLEDDKKKLYLARWTQSGGDGNLYRAKVTDRSPCGQYACLYFIDFGNTQIVPLNNPNNVYPLEKISAVLCAFPPLAIRVQLDLDARLQKDECIAQRIMALMPADKPVLLKIIRTTIDSDDVTVPICELFRRSESQNELFSVNASLKYNNLSYNMEDSNNNDKTTQLVRKLERLKYVSGQMDSINKPVPSTGELVCPLLPKPSEFFDVRIPFAVNPWNFFVQPYDSANALRKLMAQLQERYNGVRTERLKYEDVIPGKIYASQHNDGIWYRTSVIKVINSGSISVFYCDFGYYANLTVKQLIPLDSEFLELPYQAIKARLAGIQPRDAKWSMDDCKHFEQLVRDKTFVSVVVAVQQDELYQCDSVLILRLIDTSTQNDIHIDQLLIDEGIAAAASNN